MVARRGAQAIVVFRDANGTQVFINDPWLAFQAISMWKLNKCCPVPGRLSSSLNVEASQCSQFTKGSCHVDPHSLDDSTWLFPVRCTVPTDAVACGLHVSPTAVASKLPEIPVPVPGASTGSTVDATALLTAPARLQGNPKADKPQPAPLQARQTDKVVDLPVTKETQVLITQEVPSTFVAPEILMSDTVVDAPVAMERRVPVIQKVPNTVEVPENQITGKVADTPVTKERHDGQSIKVVDFPVTKERQILIAHEVPNTFVALEILMSDTVVDVPVAKEKEAPVIQNAPNTVEVPENQLTDKVADIHVTKERRVGQVDKVDEFPVTKERQVPITQELPFTCVAPVIPTMDTEVDVPVTKGKPAPIIQKAPNTVEVPKSQTTDKVAAQGLQCIAPDLVPYPDLYLSQQCLIPSAHSTALDDRKRQCKRRSGDQTKCIAVAKTTRQAAAFRSRTNGQSLQQQRQQLPQSSPFAVSWFASTHKCDPALSIVDPDSDHSLSELEQELDYVSWLNSQPF